MAAASPTPQDVDILALYEDFESSFPGVSWYVNDTNSYNGTDQWGSSTYRSAAGNASAWAAQVGNRSEFRTLLVDDFEGDITANWTFADENDTDFYGVDHWGPSNQRTHGGSSAIWCAEVGTNAATTGENNTVVRRYDDYMNATALRNVSFTGHIEINLEYWYWLDSEMSYDGLMVIYLSGSWHYEDTHSRRDSGAGWQRSTVSLPATTTKLGFLFTTDEFTQYEGAYIDDVVVTGTKFDLNRDLHEYDDGMDTTMYRGVDVGAYDFARLDYRYWIDSQSNDTLEAMYFAGGAWTYTDIHSGSSGGWATSSVSIPLDTTLVGFRFRSDDLGHREGAYVDEVRVWGTVIPVACVANVTATSGMEVLTSFGYSAGAAEGLPPYTYSWSFGDGGSSLLQNPNHIYLLPGDYPGTVTVRDSLGQVCTAVAPTVTVTHDTTAVSVTPSLANLIEGETLLVYGTDGQAHPYDLDWALAPPECGSLNRTLGPLVEFTAAVSAGGSVCTVTGSIGPASASLTITVLHDTDPLTIDPPSATVAEGENLALSATDAQGHALVFSWSTTCGRVSPDTGSSTTFSAVTTGGAVCIVTSSIGTDSVSASIEVVHDTTTISVSPAGATLLEGAPQTFTAADAYTHPFDAQWSVVPASCGSFSPSTGASTTFTASTDAGGLSCTLTAAAGADTKSVTVTVNHDTRSVELSPLSVTIQEGGAQSFAVSDAFGHPFSVAWSVTPSACGSVAPASGASTTLTVASTMGGTSCTVAAFAPGLNLLASVSVNHGAPASVVVTPSAEEADEGSAVTFTAAVLDGAGHVLAGLTLTWTTTCGSLSSTTGASNSLALPESAGGSVCTVTASYADGASSVTIGVRHAGPFTITISPANPSVSGGASQIFTATVTDAYGHKVPGLNVGWSASCGSLTVTTGPATTFTAPSDIGGATCTLTASTDEGGSISEGAATVSTPMSVVLPLAGIVPIAGAVAALLFLRRRKKQGRSPPEGAV